MKSNSIVLKKISQISKATMTTFDSISNRYLNQNKLFPNYSR